MKRDVYIIGYKLGEKVLPFATHLGGFFITDGSVANVYCGTKAAQYAYKCAVKSVQADCKYPVKKEWRGGKVFMVRVHSKKNPFRLIPNHGKRFDSDGMALRVPLRKRSNEAS